jgi:DNA replication protein
MSSGAFGGFRSGSRATVVPNVFFTSLFPQIGSPAELYVCCYLFFVFGRKRSGQPCTSASELLQERPLLDALRRVSEDPERALREGLAHALRRGMLLKVRGTNGAEDGYVLNTESAGRQRQEPGRAQEDDAALADTGGSPSSQERPNIYTLYEQNIGSLMPLLIDDLDEAEQAYPAEWIEAAFREAVANNRRSWRYISRILERWSIEGPNYEASGRRAPLNPPGRRRTIGGPYRRVVERRD